MRNWLALLLPFFAVLLAVLSVMAFTGFFAERVAPEDAPWVALADVEHATGFVRTSGMAHYGMVLEQHTPGNLIRDPEDRWVYPLTAPYQSEERMIKVLVSSPVEPEDLVDLEMLTVEGWVSPLTPDLLPYDVQRRLGRDTDYYLADDVVWIEAVRVEPGLDPRARP